MKFILSSIFVLSFSLHSYAQCMMYEVPLNQRIDNAVIILEGKVMQSQSYWQNDPHLILTSHLIKVFKVFKGNFSSTQIEVITEGGIVGNRMLKLDPGLELEQGETGIFFLYPSGNTPVYSLTQSTNYNVYAAMQGFIKYVDDHSAIEPFHKYSNIDTELYQVIDAHLNTTHQDIQAPDQSSFQNLTVTAVDSSAVVSVTSFTPTTIRAGCYDTLTINGTGFTTNSGSAAVQFSNADNGGASFFSASAFHIISWTTTKIVIMVPSKAGTGPIKVIDNAGLSQTTASSLTVTYNESNVTDCDAGASKKQPREVNNSGSGGYLFKYNTAFNTNAPAKAAFVRAVQTWRCATLINLNISGTTSAITCEGSDGTNIVTFDGSCALGSGVLGTCYSFYSGCGSGCGSYNWSVDELDIKFKTSGTDGVTWNFGPAATPFANYDLESVFLHELGHGHQLGHVNNSVDVMHYAISNGTDHRTLDATSDIAGGLDVMTRSVISYSCGTTAMTAITACSCSLAANGGAGTWTWTGATSSDWFCPSNWDVGTLPDASSDVIIASGTPNNPLIAGATANCKTITINGTAIVNINTVSATLVVAQ